ncbi:MAG TPA: hypothetical protein VIF32_06150 [Gemmatimonadaceae bacterium]
MNCSELAALLQREGFNPRYYRIESVDAGQGEYEYWLMRRTGAAWQVLSVASGVERTIGIYDTEMQACEVFRACLESDAGARNHLVASFPNRDAADTFVAALARSGIKPRHRDEPVMGPGDQRQYRVFVDGRDVELASRIRVVLLSSGSAP